MEEIVVEEDKVYIISDTETDENDEPLIVEYTRDEYEALVKELE